MVFRIIKPFLNEETRRRIVMLGCKSTDYFSIFHLSPFSGAPNVVICSWLQAEASRSDRCWPDSGALGRHSRRPGNRRRVVQHARELGRSDTGGVLLERGRPREWRGRDVSQGWSVTIVRSGACRWKEQCYCQVNIEPILGHARLPTADLVSSESGFCRYTFWTRDYDIKFGVRRKATSSGEPEKSLVPLKKYAAQSVPVDNTFNCDTPATCSCRKTTKPGICTKNSYVSAWFLQMFSHSTTATVGSTRRSCSTRFGRSTRMTSSRNRKTPTSTSMNRHRTRRQVNIHVVFYIPQLRYVVPVKQGNVLYLWCNYMS